MNTNIKDIENLEKENNEQEDKVEIPNWVTSAMEKRKEKILKGEIQHLITEKEAYDIANSDENLKTDFCKNSNRYGISFLVFTDKKIKLVKIDHRKYWMIQILRGEISQIEDDGHGGEIFLDGVLSRKELDKLRCLIDVETGNYIYYPKRRFFNFINRDDDEYEDEKDDDQGNDD